MLQVIHAFGGKDAGFDFFKKLQDNNVGPSASTGKLTALVNKGELYVANGDLQMNMSQMADNPNIRVFWPAGPDGKRSTFALPYYVGLVKGAPDADNGKKLIDFLLSQGGAGHGQLRRDRRAGPQGRDADRRQLTRKLQDAHEGRDDLDARLGAGPQGPPGRRRALARSDRQLMSAAADATGAGVVLRALPGPARSRARRRATASSFDARHRRLPRQRGARLA